MFKTIVNNTLAQLVAKFFGAGLTLLTTYLIIQLAGLELYGQLTKILVLVAIGFTTIDFGLNAEALRSNHSRLDIFNSLKNVLFARLLLSFLAFLVLNLIILLLPGSYSVEVKSVFWLGSLAIIFQGIYTSCNAYFQHSLSYWRSTLSVILGTLVGASLTLYNIYTSPTLLGLVIANTLGYFFMALTALSLLPKPALREFNPTLSQALSLLKKSLTLGLILLSSVVASKIDTVILGIFQSPSVLGEYGFAYRIFDVILVLPVFVMNAIYPLSLRASQSGRKSLLSKSTLSMTGIGLIVAILLWLGSPLLLYIKPDLFIALSTLRILALILPLFYITAPLMWGLIAAKKDHLVLMIYVIAALFNTIINLATIPTFGALAAALNTGITELFIFLSLLYFTKRI